MLNTHNQRQFSTVGCNLMKKSVIILSILGFISSCNILHKNRKYLQNEKILTTIQYYHLDGFCSQTIYINNDSSFIFEHGCENNSHITIGRWKITNDTIELISGKKEDLLSIKNLHNENVSKDIVICFVDLFGNPINNLLVIPFEKNKKYEKIMKQTYFDENKLMVKPLKTDVNGNISIDAKQIDSLEIYKLNELRFSTKNFTSKTKITININKDLLDYDYLIFEEYKSLRLLYSSEKIIYCGLELNKQK